jgi:hypothetical protein
VPDAMIVFGSEADKVRYRKNPPIVERTTAAARIRGFFDIWFPGLSAFGRFVIGTAR